MSNNSANILSSTLVILALTLVSCTEKSAPTKVGKDSGLELEYSADLSKLRPKIESEELEQDATAPKASTAVQSKFDMTSEFDVLLDSIKVRNDTMAILNGYTILVYSGINERDAGRVRNRLFDILPEMQAVMQYKLPTYFVKVGTFYQQIEAQPLYEKIKRYYPNATVVPEQFKLDK
ncbi:MAG: hypothetical protein COW03_13060 [Cytophagales bacterium CG12_big_fil_rev_8_21_14_0_65_40_12]|nr:MAG: hypothetical protein COW03_13060 [Cytophagales bacterium CG12_big_fil_rev_8_21_14_0_65_40_12]PIW03069.1 MAG: hypothetical protein COW40_17135 [Cytophagales bacterium CG17_big_fil_post_rev_8_21_14_2_50_40_13]